MRKVCFLAERFLWEKGMELLLYQELSEIIKAEEEIEFWFHTCHETFAQKAIECIYRLREEYSDKNLLIVAVIDPLKLAERGGDVDSLIRISQFPENKVDRIEHAPLFDGKCEQHRNRFIQHFYKIDRWVYQQCDDLIAYYYDNLPDTTMRFIKAATARKSNLTLHHLYLPETKYRIEILIEQLPERERTVVLALKQGKNYREIAEQLHMSYNRAQQLSNRANVQIRRWLRLA